jgi:hypothetical protein
MKRVVLVYGLIAGVVLGTLMTVSIDLCANGTLGFDKGEVIGYTAMFLAYLLIFFAIRKYRDEYGSISFGRAVAVGLLITLISSVMYAATWEVLYYKFTPDFADKMTAAYIGQMQKQGKPAAEIEAKRVEMAQMKRLMDNPVTNAAIAIIEPLPVGVLATLISAAILRRRRGGAAPVAATA